MILRISTVNIIFQTINLSLLEFLGRGIFMPNFNSVKYDAPSIEGSRFKLPPLFEHAQK